MQLEAQGKTVIFNFFSLNFEVQCKILLKWGKKKDFETDF